MAVNGAHLLEYRHRVDLERVDTVCVSGRVKVQTVAVVPPPSVSPPASGGLSSVLQGSDLFVFVCVFVC